MHFRSILASWLVVIVLSLSYGASACEVSCDLGSFHTHCHGNAPASAHDAMQAESHHHCPGMGGAIAQSSQPHSLGPSMACMHKLCAELPVLLKSNPALRDNDQPAALALNLLHQTQAPSSCLAAEDPPRHTSSHIPLQTVLRI